VRLRERERERRREGGIDEEGGRGKPLATNLNDTWSE